MTTPQSSRTERATFFAGIVALARLLGALGFQYLRHLAPCEMCHWQRWPLIGAAVSAFVVLPLARNGQRKAAIGTAGAAALGGLLLAFYWTLLAGWQPVLIAAAIILLLFLPLLDTRFAFAPIALLALSGLIGAYQAGMQWDILPGPQACTSARFIVGSDAPPPQVSCNAVTWSLFGLSLAAYNAIFSLGGALAAALFRKGRA